jgi:hypothetical protein
MPGGDETWDDLQCHASDSLNGARIWLNSGRKGFLHRRGKFATLGVEISHGSSQEYPQGLKHTDAEREVIEGLLREESFI